MSCLCTKNYSLLYMSYYLQGHKKKPVKRKVFYFGVKSGIILANEGLGVLDWTQNSLISGLDPLIKPKSDDPTSSFTPEVNIINISQC